MSIRHEVVQLPSGQHDDAPQDTTTATTMLSRVGVHELIEQRCAAGQPDERRHHGQRQDECAHPPG